MFFKMLVQAATGGEVARITLANAFPLIRCNVRGVNQILERLARSFLQSQRVLVVARAAPKAVPPAWASLASLAPGLLGTQSLLPLSCSPLPPTSIRSNVNNFIYPLMHFSNEACDILENELQKAIFSLSGRRFCVLFWPLYHGACA